MEFLMAPPAKRRRLSSPVNDVSQDTEVKAKESSASFFHGIEHLDGAPASAQPRTQLPHHVEEVHLEIRKQSVGHDEYARLQRRQGTAATSDATSTSADVVVSVVASVDALGSTIAATTTAITVDLSNLPSFPLTSTTVVVESSGATSSSSTVESNTDGSASSTPESTSDASTSTALSSASSSSPSSTSPTSSSPTSSSPTSSSPTSSTPTSSSPSGSAPTTTGGAGFIGLSPNRSTAATSSAVSASISDSAASNGSSTTSEATTGTNSALLQSLTPSSNRLNLTTSATTFTSDGSTFTSRSTVNLASATSSSGSQSSHASSSTSSSNADHIYSVTLSGGKVVTITRSDHSYATTLPGGQLTTVSPFSSDDNSSASSTDSNESVTTITTDGSTVRSTVFSTTIPSSAATANGDIGTGAVGIGQGTATSSATSSTSSAAGSGSGNSSTPPAGTIAGGVVGGAAGLAVVLLVAMLFLRWYRRKAQMGHQALPPNSAAMSPDLDHEPTSRGGPGMAERAGLMPFAGAVPALFRHQNRSRDSASVEPATGERGFTRVSGRKLPSAWSEGMTAPPQSTMSPPPTMPLVGGDHDRNLSSTSFYRDSSGFYGGDGRPASPNPFADLSPIDTNVTPPAGNTKANDEQLIMSPGPQRTPTVHHGGPYVMSPSTASSDARGMLSPGAPPWSAGSTATFARSDTPGSLDGSRGSRFMEEV